MKLKEKYDIFDKNEKEEVRYILGKTVDSKKKAVLCIGVNPSFANRSRKDLTMNILEKSIGNKYGCFIMMNLTPQRTSKVSNLDFEMDEKLSKDNLSNYKMILEKYNVKDIICALGNSIKLRGYLVNNLSKIFDVINEYDNKMNFYCFETTKSGNPVHPRWIQYQNKDTKEKVNLQYFDLKTYIEKLSYKSTK